MVQLQEEVGDYKAQGYQIFALSQDSFSENKSVMKKNKLSFPILSDGAMAVASKFGLVFSVNDETVKKFEQYGIDLIGLYGRKKPVLAVPAVYIIGADGKVKFQYVNPDYSQRLHPKVLRSAMEVYK